MVSRVIKRDGRKVIFSERRIRTAISQAMNEAGESTYGKISDISSAISNAIDVKFDGQTPTVEQIQDTIIEILTEMGLKKVATTFAEYRNERNRVRETKSEIMKAINKIGTETTRDNANVGNNFSAKLLQIASVANKWANLAQMPKEHAKAHEDGVIHIHDLDSFNLTTNCLHIDLEDKLINGFNTGYGYIKPPKRIESAGELACIILQSSQNDLFGGQSFSDFDNALAPIVELTRKEVLNDGLDWSCQLHYNDNTMDAIVNAKLRKRIDQAMQGVVYNLNTMHCRAGSQVPFSSVNIGIPKTKDAALICESFLNKYNEGLGMGEQPVFPNIIFRLKEGVNANEDDPYYYLRLLAEKVAANRMNPTFRSLDCSLSLPYYNKGIIAATMGCRTDLLANINGPEGPTGRGNNFPVTINLPRIAIEAEKDIDKFYRNLGKLMDMCAEQLMYRYDVVKKLKVKDLPFAAGQHLMKGSENLSPDDSIEPILKNGTMGIGFIGLAETLTSLNGKHHGESKESQTLGLKIMEFMTKKIEGYKEKHRQNFSLYATPAEGLSGRFIKFDQKKYGVIKGVTDKEYYTNGFHIPVKFSIPATDKMGIEAPYHKLCTAGHISYVEIDGGDIETRRTLIHRMNDFIKDETDMSYWGYNFHIRYCKDDGFRIETNSSTCDICGGSNIQGISRVTGYMSLDERFGPGKVAERADRVKHS